MISEAIPSGTVSLSPRQRSCLRLVYDRQATSKEIAAELGISKTTVDGYIAEAVDLLGARDRREAARLAFGPRAVSGGDAAGVSDSPSDAALMLLSTRPWATRDHPRNSLSLGQTLAWIAMIAVGSLLALALATVIGNGVPVVAREVQGSFGKPH